MDSYALKFAQFTGSLVYVHDQLARMINLYGLANRINPGFTRIYPYLPIAEKRKWYLCGIDGICSKTKEDTDKLFAILDEAAKNPNTDLSMVYKLTYLHNVLQAARKWLDENPAAEKFFTWAINLPKAVSWGNTTANTMLEYAFLGGRAYGVAYVK